jgi:hypothetical protein
MIHIPFCDLADGHRYVGGRQASTFQIQEAGTSSETMVTPATPICCLFNDAVGFIQFIQRQKLGSSVDNEMKVAWPNLQYTVVT